MKSRIFEGTLIILSFIVSLYLYSLFSYFGIRDFIQEDILTEYFETNIWHLEVIFSGLFLGILFIHINQLTERKRFRRKSFGFNILLRSSLYLIALSLVILAVYALFILLGLVTNEQMNAFLEIISFHFIMSFLIYYGLFVLLINFVLYLSKKMGPGTLFDLLTGKYYHPRNEELVFLFLDLKGSTMLAEKLGSNIYSSFLKECVHELTPIIQKHQARVYQYVGDEVVLFWQKGKGFNQLRCIEAFFDFTSALSERSDYFMSKYGHKPKFKAGMDIGIVTMTEIGDVKREVAFHGDVLNTASRLEKKCNEFNEKLLVTQHVTDEIEPNKKFRLRFLDDLPLRGKTQNLKFYAVLSDQGQQ